MAPMPFGANVDRLIAFSGLPRIPSQSGVYLIVFGRYSRGVLLPLW